MKQRNKIVSLCLCGILSLGMLAGCGTSSTGGDVKTVTVWSGNTHTKAVVEPMVDEWNKTVGKEKGIFLDYQFKEGGSITQIIDTALQSGEAADFLQGGKVKNLVENDYIVAIDDLPGGKEYLKQYEGRLVDEKNSYLGKTYTLPNSGGSQGLIYNKDMFREAGIVDENGEPTPPKTWDEVREYAKRLTNSAEKKYGIILPMKWGGWFNSDVLHAGQSSVGHIGYNPVTGKYEYEGFAPIVDCFMGMKEDGSVYPGAETLDNDPARALFATGVIGMKLAYSFDVGVLNDQFPAECDWGVAPYPVLDLNNQYKHRMANGATPFINKKSVETVGGDVLMEVLKFITSEAWAKTFYKEGIDIPYKTELTEGIDVKDIKKIGWAEFAAIVDDSAVDPMQPPRESGEALTIQEHFINEVWTGEKTSLEMLKEYGEEMNKGVEKYMSNHLEENLEKYIIKDWDIRR